MYATSMTSQSSQAVANPLTYLPSPLVSDDGRFLRSHTRPFVPTGGTRYMSPAAFRRAYGVSRASFSRSATADMFQSSASAVAISWSRSSSFGKRRRRYARTLGCSLGRAVLMTLDSDRGVWRMRPRVGWQPIRPHPAVVLRVVAAHCFSCLTRRTQPPSRTRSSRGPHMADEEDDLPEDEGEEATDFPPADRKITTQPYDLSIQTLVEQWDAKMLVIPDVQREYVWDTGRASRLIESLALNIPVPPLYFAETKDAHFEVIDGHQRVKSIARYLNNEFALSGLRVLTEYAGLRFHQLPTREQRFLKTRTLRVVVIAPESHPNMKFEVFERLNTGGISLNAQELRNSIYRGSLNDAMKALVRNPQFRACIGTKTPRHRMVDEELVLRFLALHDHLEQYRPPLKRFLNDYMSANKDASDAWIEERRVVFATTMDRIARVLGAQAFRLIDESGEPLRDESGKPLPRGVNRALFDAQSLTFSWLDAPIPNNRRAAVVASISDALADEDTQDAVRRATGDRRRILLRLRAMVTALESAGVEVEPPIDLED